MKKRILFAGGSGLLSVCWSRYISHDFDVSLALHERIIDISGVNCVKLDLTTFDSILSALKDIKPHYLVNAAALTNIEFCENNQDLAYQTNVNLAINLAKACQLLSIKLIHISTDHIFDGFSSFYTELSSPNPLNIYGKTKLEAEIGIRAVTNNYLIIRTNFFDNGTYYRRSFSDWILDQLKQEEVVSLFNDIYFTPIHVQFLLRYVHALLNNNYCGIFHVSGPKRITKYDFGIKLAHTLSLNSSLIQPISIADRPDLVVRPRDMSLDNSKIMTIMYKKP